jgi:RNA polymerase sigma-70 factor (ECF subfamily)
MNASCEQDENIRRVVTKYSNNIVRIAFAYAKNITDAQDIAQEVFFAYFKNQTVFTSEEHEKAWLIRVTINKSKNYIKARWFLDRNPLPENLSYLPEEENSVLEAVLNLDEKYRIPIHLHYYEGYSILEIAVLLHARPATIGTRLARGRNILKVKLGGFSYE